MDEIKHIAIIPDGNRRWAKQRSLPPFLGHKSGVKPAEEVFKRAVQLKISYFTFWASSLDNVVKRSKEEVAFLFELFGQYFKKLLNDEEIEKNDVRVRVIGRWQEVFPEKLKAVIEEVIKKTEKHSRHHLTLLMAYSGNDEMMAAVMKISQAGIKNINEKVIKENLWTRELPPVDLVIRTGGEPHWSAGFMMWDMADAKIHFSESLWPDFTPEEFEKIVRNAAEAERRFGK